MLELILPPALLLLLHGVTICTGNANSSALLNRHVSNGNGIGPSSPAALLQEATRKGEELISWIKDPSKAGSKAQTTWTEFFQIEKFGWGIAHTQKNLENFDEPISIRTLISGSRKGIRWEMRHVGCDKSYTDSHGNLVALHYPISRQYRKTDAVYVNTYWPDKGWIVADSNSGPEAQVAASKTPKQRGVNGKRPEPWDRQKDLLPASARLSDIWWPSWTKACKEINAKVPEIKGVVQKEIINEETREILKELLKGPVPAWKNRIEIKPSHEGFAALVRTPVVKPVVFFLIQQRAHDQLPAMGISKIVLYLGDEGRPNMEVWLGRLG